jgi:hypothetical protein
MTEYRLKNIWYLKGSNYQKSLGSDVRLQPAPLVKFGLPSNISHICYVKNVEFFYFVTEDSPQEIQGRYLGIYNNWLNKETLEIQYNASCNLMTSMAPHGDIISIASTEKHIYAIVKELGRGNDNFTFHLLKYEVSSTGNAYVKHDAILDLTAVLVDPDEKIHISVVKRDYRKETYRIYLSGKGFHAPCYFNYITSLAKTITPIPIEFKEVYNRKPKFEILHAYNYKKEEEYKKEPYSAINPVTLLGVDCESNDVFIISHIKYSELKISKLKLPIGNKIMQLAGTITSLSVSLSFPNILNEDEGYRNLGIFADNMRNKIYAFELVGKQRIYNIIGGGELDLHQTISASQEKNIHPSVCNAFERYSVPDIDSLIQISEHGFMAGTREKGKWFALMLPSSREIGTSEELDRRRRSKINYTMS